VQKLEERTLSGTLQGRAWRATFTRDERYVARSIKAEVAAGQWMSMGRPPEPSFGTEAEMRRAIERYVAERFSR
jgi:hypothetical protein